MRLGRPPCGKALPFLRFLFFLEAAPHRQRRSLHLFGDLTVRLSLTHGRRQSRVRMLINLRSRWKREAAVQARDGIIGALSPVSRVIVFTGPASFAVIFTGVFSFAMTSAKPRSSCVKRILLKQLNELATESSSPAPQASPAASPAFSVSPSLPQSRVRVADRGLQSPTSDRSPLQCPDRRRSLR